MRKKKSKPRNFLQKEQKEKLLQIHKEKRNKIADRVKAILLYDTGWSYTDIAIALQVEDETIRRHIQEYQQDNKLDNISGGKESRLNEKQTKELVNYLDEHTCLYVKEIVEHVKKTYQISYSISGMTKWLYQNNFRYKKPHAVPAKADQEKQKAFLEAYQELKKSTCLDNNPIYFVDSVHPQHQTHLAYGWILKGSRKLVATTARQYRVNVIGGVNIRTHGFVYKEVERVNKEGIKGFLEEVRKKHQGNKLIHIIWENAAYHKNEEVMNYSKELGIELHYLPAYSPNLNLIERIWKKMHQRVSYNKYYAEFKEFKKSIIKYLEELKDGIHTNTLLNLLTENFNILDSPVLSNN